MEELKKYLNGGKTAVIALPIVSLILLIIAFIIYINNNVMEAIIPLIFSFLPIIYLLYIRIKNNNFLYNPENNSLIDELCNDFPNSISLFNDNIRITKNYIIVKGSTTILSITLITSIKIVTTRDEDTTTTYLYASTNTQREKQITIVPNNYKNDLEELKNILSKKNSNITYIE